MRLAQLSEGQCLANYNKIFAEGTGTPSRDQGPQLREAVGAGYQPHYAQS